jgi:hypothetical protein
MSTINIKIDADDIQVDCVLSKKSGAPFSAEETRILILTQEIFKARGVVCTITGNPSVPVTTNKTEDPHAELRDAAVRLSKCLQVFSWYQSVGCAPDCNGPGCLIVYTNRELSVYETNKVPLTYGGFQITIQTMGTPLPASA